MIKRNETTRTNGNNKVRKSGVGSYLLIFPLAAILLGGFFFAARQHFASMDYGMKNSRLRKQIDQLEAEKQRLIHAREVSLSPTEIKRAAKKAGLLDLPSVNGHVTASADPVELKAASIARQNHQPLVQKTSVVEPATNRTEMPAKKSGAEGKKLVAMR